ncbi:MAG: hypothetical protein H6Q90_3152 [Deltaproteobacteria bacterium]|nr:hypothetical protein [Deltaproteobacteria bacterium]
MPSRFWVELELDNRGASPWDVRATDLTLSPAGTHAIGFAEYPNALPKARVEPAVIVLPSAGRHVWVRFDNVRTQMPLAAKEIDDPAPLTIEVRSGDTTMPLELSDPAHGSPIWTPTEWPYFGMMGFGTGLFYVPPDPVKQVAMTVDVTMSVHRRFGEFDAGAIGKLRFGIGMAQLAMLPAEADVVGFYGGGLTGGYTTYFRGLYLRSALDVIVGRSGHFELDTTPMTLGAELDFGMARRSLYPYRDRQASVTLALYVRADRTIASLSKIEAPIGYGFSFGLTMRVGS